MKLFDRLFPKPPPPSDLDQPLFWWSPRDPFTVRNACENVAIFGKTGSGKTSGSGNLLLEALISLKNSGGL